MGNESLWVLQEWDVRSLAETLKNHYPEKQNKKREGGVCSSKETKET